MELSMVMSRLEKVRDARGWRELHTPQNLAIAVAVEAAELLALFAWGGADDAGAADETWRRQLADEIADVLATTLWLASVAGIDPDAAIENKLGADDGRFMT